MLAEQRHKFILDELAQNKSVTVNGVCAKLGVSAETVRRDLILLETHGKLRRVFGGAVPVELPAHFESLKERFDRNTELKSELSNFAADLIDEGDIVAIDSGSTAKEFALVLSKRFKDLTVVTYSNTVFNILKDKFPVILVGGEYKESDDYFVGHIAENTLKQLRFNKAVVFPVTLSVSGGIETYTLASVSLQQILMERADRTLVLADSDKFGGHALIKVCDLSEEHIYVTDSRVNPDTVKEFAENGLVLVSKEQEEEQC